MYINKHIATLVILGALGSTASAASAYTCPWKTCETTSDCDSGSVCNGNGQCNPITCPAVVPATDCRGVFPLLPIVKPGDEKSLRTAVTCAAPGAIVIVPPGTYHLLAPLFMPANVTLLGASVTYDATPNDAQNVPNQSIDLSILDASCICDNYAMGPGFATPGEERTVVVHPKDRITGLTFRSPTYQRVGIFGSGDTGGQISIDGNSFGDNSLHPAGEDVFFKAIWLNNGFTLEASRNVIRIAANPNPGIAGMALTTCNSGQGFTAPPGTVNASVDLEQNYVQTHLDGMDIGGGEGGLDDSFNSGDCHMTAIVRGNTVVGAAPFAGSPTGLFIGAGESYNNGSYGNTLDAQILNNTFSNWGGPCPMGDDPGTNPECGIGITLYSFIGFGGNGNDVQALVQGNTGKNLSFTGFSFTGTYVLNFGDIQGPNTGKARVLNNDFSQNPHFAIIASPFVQEPAGTLIPDYCDSEEGPLAPPCPPQGDPNDPSCPPPASPADLCPAGTGEDNVFTLILSGNKLSPNGDQIRPSEPTGNLMNCSGKGC